MDVMRDNDPAETREWRQALDSVLAFEGPERAESLLEALADEARRKGALVPYTANTPYLNTIPPAQEARHPGNREVERRIRSLIRWNALATVLRANKESSELGGHIASFQSAATLYNVGFMHFWHGATEKHGGDLLYMQGHSSPGFYARAFLEGRITEAQLLGFCQEVDGGGLSSYPHPWLMPDFWQFPTVSMGLGPIMAIYQARFLKYLGHRCLAQTEGRKVWAFLGDGETDEPESLGAIGMAGREHLDNLIFVINCNLRRLDGPVRGNGKIIQELEAEFRGAGWNVIKVIWGSGWDKLLARDTSGLLLQRMEETVDGDYQALKSKNGAYVREHFFGKYPETRALVADMTDDEIWALARGGHDPQKVYAAYAAAVRHGGQPTVILAETVKGYGMGEGGEGQNITHQQKKMGEAHLREFRDRFGLPLTDEQIHDVPFLRLPGGSPEEAYLRERRAALGSYVPARRAKTGVQLQVPPLPAFDAQLKASGEGRAISTTMAFVRILNTLMRDKSVGKHVVPIVPDESRTFGMEGMFRQFGIYSQVGQLYHSLGTAVTVVELMDQIIPGADRDMVTPLMKRISKQYAAIHLKTKVTKIEAGPDGLTTHLEGGGAPATAVFDKVLVAVGRKPNDRLIGAENAGVRVDERGYIPVDKQMRTNVSHIFAIGDVVGQPMLAHKATHEGKVAAGKNSVFDARVIPSVAYTDPEVAWVGLTENEAKAKGVKYGKGVFPWAASGRSLSLGRDEGLTKVLFDEGTERIIGCGIVGPSAGDLIAEAALAIEMGADATDIGATIHPHPALSETVGMAAEAFEGTITDLYMPKKH